MANLTNIPVIDWFETTLASSRNGSVWSVAVLDVPDWTIETGETSYIVINPWKSNMQVAQIDWWNSGAKTFNVISISIEKGNGVDYTAQTHAANSIVRFSNNYAFWRDIRTAISSKAWTDTSNTWTDTQTFDKVIATGYTKDAVYADATARDIAIPSPSNWMRIYNTAVWLLQKYQAWAWVDDTAWASTPNGSETIAGKREWATLDQMGTATETGESGAKLVVMNKNLVKTSSGVWDENKIIILNSSGKIETSFLPITDVFTNIFTAWTWLSAWEWFRTWISWNFLDIASNWGTADPSSYIGIWRDNSSQSIGMSVPVGATWLLVNITASLLKIGSPTSQITMTLYSNIPWTTVVATSTNTISEASLTWSATTHTFTFSSEAVVGGTTYYAKLSVPRANSSSNYSKLTWLVATPDNIYYISSANIWEIYIGWYRANYSLTINPWETATKKYKALSTKAPFLNIEWIVQSTVIADAPMSWILWGRVWWYTGLTPWAVYYLKNDGTIWTTPWTTSVKVGRAISTTELNFVPPL